MQEHVVLTRPFILTKPGGYCIRGKLERAHTIGYLERVEEFIKWKTKAQIEALKKEWEDMDDVEKDLNA